MPVEKILSKHEQEKKRIIQLYMYNWRIKNVEHGTFTSAHHNSYLAAYSLFLCLSHITYTSIHSVKS